MRLPSSDGVSRKRPWLAVVLAVVYPGLGHLYLRLWGRALMWFALVVLSTSVLVPEDALPTEVAFDSLLTAGEAIPTQTALVVLGISLLSVVDAYLMANRRNDQVPEEPGGETTSCPECGKELDADLDFCHWCTTPLDGSEPDE